MNGEQEYGVNNPRRSPRKLSNRKRPHFTKTKTISPSPINRDNGILNIIQQNYSNNSNNNSNVSEPPKKRIKIDPEATNSFSRCMSFHQFIRFSATKILN